MDTNPPYAAGDIPRSCSGWVMLDGYPRRIPCRNGDGDHDDEDLSATMAEGTTSGGERVRFALKATPPPRFSRLYFEWQRREEQPSSTSRRLNRLGLGELARFAHPPELDRRVPKVVAAHRSCILLSLVFPTTTTKGGMMLMECTEDYFVYQAHGSATTLARLPACHHGPALRRSQMGILCRDSSSSSFSFIAAHLAGRPGDGEGKVCMLKQGSASWEEKALPVVRRRGGGQEQEQELSCWVTDRVLPCGDSLCFVDYLRGLLFCDLFSPDPVLRYIPLPDHPCQGDAPPDPDAGYRGALDVYRSVCAASNGVIKFVEVAYPALWYPTSMELPGVCSCPSSSPFAIYSWIWTGDKWVLEAKIEAEAFWALTDAMGMGLPRSEPEFPLVDMEDPRIVYFVLRKLGGGAALEDTFLLAVDMPSKAVHSYSSVQPRRPGPYAPHGILSSLQHGGCSSSRSSGQDGGRDSDTASQNLTCFEPFISCEISKYLDVPLLTTRREQRGCSAGRECSDGQMRRGIEQ